MAPLGGGLNSGSEGWGQYLQYSFPTTHAVVNNSAFAGRSARSFTREGRFQWIANNLKKGDWVVIEFGHNDGGSPYPASADNGRGDCPGAGEFIFMILLVPRRVVL
jgi:rhamnogalacturonan acetylesterase